MKKALLVMAAISCFGFVATGCGGEDETCETYTCNKGWGCQEGLFGPTCVVNEETCKAVGWVFNATKNECEDAVKAECTSSADCGEGKMCDSATLKCVDDPDYNPGTGESTAYRYVRIDDLSPKTSTGSDPGADIDAVVLTKSAAAGGGKYYAENVYAYGRGDGTGACTKDTCKKERSANAYDPMAILHEPDSLVDYGQNGRKCNYYKVVPTSKDSDDAEFTFVSLGGEGGYIIVEMGEKIENGDSLTVLELGDCDVPGETTFDKKDFTISKEKAEAVKVAIGVSDKADGDWSVVVIDDKKAQNGIITTTIDAIK